MHTNDVTSDGLAAQNQLLKFVQEPFSSFVFIGARVISLLRHQDRPNSLISSYQGNNEVAVWNIDEPLQRNQVFWPSSVEPLSMTRVNHKVHEVM